MQRFWLSFANEESNQGVVLTEAKDAEAALEKCSRFGIVLEEGMEAKVITFPSVGENAEADAEWKKFPKDKLITRQELVDAGYLPVRA